MLRRLLPSLLLLCSIVAAANPTDEIERLVRTHVRADGPGCVVLVSRDSSVIFERAFGMADVERGIPMRTDAVFDLASCSKQFTAMAIMILHDRDRLSFDDPARKYLPELPDRSLTLRHLLQMTSGLPDYLAIMDHLDAHGNADVLRAIANRPRLFAPGAKFAYSDTNYVLLALTVERVSGEPFARFLRREIFTPANMPHTVLLERAGQIVPNRPQGYSPTKDGFRINRQDTGIYGDGQIMSCAEDLANWDRALRENLLVRRETLAEAFTSGKLNDGTPTGYGFGWYVGREGGEKIVRHGGGWAGTSVHILRRLDDPLTIIVLSNLEKFPSGKLAEQIADRFPPK